MLNIVLEIFGGNLTVVNKSYNRLKWRLATEITESVVGHTQCDLFIISQTYRAYNLQSRYGLVLNLFDEDQDSRINLEPIQSNSYLRNRVVY